MKEFVEKLISKLEEESYWTQSTFDEDGYSNDDSEEVIDLHKAIEIINELAEEYSADTSQKSANGWVPCSERLPKPYKDVLVCTDAGEVDVDFYSEYIQNFIGLKGTSRTAIAWQPLPAPYISKKEEWKNKVMKHFTSVE